MLDDGSVRIQSIKCKESIKGHDYYIVKLDCLYDGEHISSCKTIILCANCYHEFDKWLKK